MPNRDLVVDYDAKLESFLARQKIQPWRIPILVKYGGVRVFRGRGGPSVVLDKGPETRVASGDVVRLLDPLPTTCIQALQKVADADWHDYAIVPGTTPFDLLMLAFMKARTRTIVIQDPFSSSLDGFINRLAVSPEIVHPIRHLVVVGHASFSGMFKIVIDALPHQQEFVHYEDLEVAVAKKFMVIDVSLMMPRPKGQGAPQLRLLGCNIGAQAPYMLKLKEALGNQVTVIAPTRIVFPDTLRSPRGPLAYMGYDFAVSRASQLKDQAAVIREMLAESNKKRVRLENPFLLENGKPVTAADLKKWVPRKPNNKPFSRLSTQLLPEPGSTLNAVRLPVFGSGLAKRRFVYNEQAKLFKDGFPSIPLKKDTGKLVDRKQVVKSFLQLNDHRFSDAHPLPLYIRLGYESMDEFMDGWDWRFKFAKGVLEADPVRWQYQLWQPIATVGVNELIMNFYPDPKTRMPKRFRTLVPIEKLQVNDRRFFRMY